MPGIGLMDPDPEGLASAAARFDLHLLEVEDAYKGYQPAKLERYGDTMFVVPRPASHDDRRESVHFGEVHLSVGPQIVITVRHDAVPDLSAGRDALEAEPLGLGSPDPHPQVLIPSPSPVRHGARVSG
ncbi:CorA family divalent cation transporter [Streptomyces sp. NPDC048643]|uniref:CorA family divalent cation transporter n=1 Tax=Streptomyces sp. NPDC048643 TaxID=3155637 RepID=UPI00341BACB8